MWPPLTFVNAGPAQLFTRRSADGTFDAKLGGTFAVAVIACILGVVHAAATYTFARSAGDGLFYRCSHECMAMNNDTNAAVGSGGGGAWTNSQQQPVR